MSYIIDVFTCIVSSLNVILFQINYGGKNCIGSIRDKINCNKNWFGICSINSLYAVTKLGLGRLCNTNLKAEPTICLHRRPISVAKSRALIHFHKVHRLIPVFVSFEIGPILLVQLKSCIEISIELFRF